MISYNISGFDMPDKPIFISYNHTKLENGAVTGCYSICKYILLTYDLALALSKNLYRQNSNSIKILLI